MYDLKIFDGDGLWRTPENNRISFEDHSNDFVSDSTLKGSCPIVLPNPRYITIHAVIAGILNTSGAGKFFDELLARYRDNDGSLPGVRSWQDLETLMVEQMLKQSFTSQFELVMVQ